MENKHPIEIAFPALENFYNSVLAKAEELEIPKCEDAEYQKYINNQVFSLKQEIEVLMDKALIDYESRGFSL